MVYELIHADTEQQVDTKAFATLDDPQSYDAFSYDYDKLPAFALTTVDNPFNPFTHFDEWYNWDEANGYHTCSYLASVSTDSEALSDRDSEIARALAIDTILNLDPFEIYTVVAKPKFDSTLNAS